MCGFGWGAGAAGKCRSDGRTGTQRAQHFDRINGCQRQLGAHVSGDGGQAEHTDLKPLPGRLRLAQVLRAQVVDAEHQGLARNHLLDDLDVACELVADRRANQVGAVGVEAFVDQQIDLAEVDTAQVDGDLFVRWLGREGDRGGAFCWHGWHPSTIHVDGK